MCDLMSSKDGHTYVVFGREEVVSRPDPRGLPFGRTRIVLIRSIVVLWSAGLAAAGTWALIQGQWSGMAGVLFGAIFGIGAFVWTPDLGTGEEVRVRCPCCDHPTLLLDEDTFEALRDASTGESAPMAFEPGDPCPVCEWQTGTLPAWDPRPDPAGYELEVSRDNFRVHCRYYSPDEVIGWGAGTATTEERAAKREIEEFADQLIRHPDGVEKCEAWKALERASDRLRRDTAFRLGGRAAWLHRVGTLKRLLEHV